LSLREIEARGMTGKVTPLYVVCSPCRCVGKTLVSRLLTEFYVLGGRPVAAFDLADEGPQLTDYLPRLASIADIGDIRGQMAFFDRLIASDSCANVIDLSHRSFKHFFTIVEEIGFFQEALRHSIEPLILFIIDPDPKSPEAYARFRGKFTEAASLLPVRNWADSSQMSDREAPSSVGMIPASLYIPPLGFSLRALIDRLAFSFCELWRAKPDSISDALDDELQGWAEGIFSQFRSLELALGCEDTSTQFAAGGSRRSQSAHRRQSDVSSPSSDPGRYVNSAAIGQRPTDVPYEVLRFAPKKIRNEDFAIDRHGEAIVDILQGAGRRLGVAEDRINELEAEITRTQDRADRAEALLQLVEKEIQERLVEPAAARRSKIDDLSR